MANRRDDQQVHESEYHDIVGECLDDVGQFEQQGHKRPVRTAAGRSEEGYGGAAGRRKLSRRTVIVIAAMLLMLCEGMLLYYLKDSQNALTARAADRELMNVYGDSYDRVAAVGQLLQRAETYHGPRDPDFLASVTAVNDELARMGDDGEQLKPNRFIFLKHNTAVYLGE